MQPREKTKVAGLLKSSKRVPVTGRRDGFARSSYGKRTRWVTAEYLSKQKPKPPRARASTAGGSSSASSTPTGLSSAPARTAPASRAACQPAAVQVYRAVCAAFPQLTTYGGQDGHGEHVNGKAIDFMVTELRDSVTRIADFLHAPPRRARPLRHHLAPAHLDHPALRRGLRRSMSDRGSPTANHVDHVHIMVN